MDLSYSCLDGFSPELYLATLLEVAHADGLHPDEEAMLNQQAESLGVSLTELPEVPHDLSELPWTTRILVYRDSVTLAYADGKLSEQEQAYLSNLAGRLKLKEETTRAISMWVNDYSNLLNRLDEILKNPSF